MGWHISLQERQLLANRREKEIASSRVALSRQDLLTQLAALAQRYAGFVAERDRGSVHIVGPGADGLKISVYESGGPVTILIGPWSDVIDNHDQAVCLVHKAIRGDGRIRIESCNKRDHLWALELREASGTWKEWSRKCVAELWTSGDKQVRYLGPTTIGRLHLMWLRLQMSRQKLQN